MYEHTYTRDRPYTKRKNEKKERRGRKEGTREGEKTEDLVQKGDSYYTAVII